MELTSYICCSEGSLRLPQNDWFWRELDYHSSSPCSIGRSPVPDFLV